MNLAADFFKKESRSPRGFLPRPLLRAGESVAPPPLPQKNSGGAHHFRFRFLDLWIKFGKIIVRVCCCFLSGAKEYDTNFRFSEKVGFSFFESDCSVPPRRRGAGLSSSPKSAGFWRANKEILMLSGE